MLNRTEMNGFAQRVLAHVMAKTTELADQSYTVPVATYIDEGRWKREVDVLFKTVPQLVAFSCEIREAGAFKAMQIAGVPLLLIRDEAGEVRAFLNVCTHRGARLVAEGCGVARRFVCPYHGWTYRPTGELAGLPAKASFGHIDEAALGLTALPVVERAGIVWAVLTPAAPLDIDEWLGDMIDMLVPLELESYHHFATRHIVGPNWKVAMDGYLENYHFLELHKNSFAVNHVPNLSVFDNAGPHKRFLFARRAISDLASLPVEEWIAGDYVGHGYNIFPNTQTAFGFIGEPDELTPGQQLLVNQVWPGDTIDTSMTTHSVFTANPVTTDEFRKATEVFLDQTFAVIRDEDYTVAESIQDGIRSGAIENFTFGRMELGLHHFHDWMDRLLAESNSLPR
jgi:phenylpropionate dioxygenase-like ring-hydroxylating dioxygenase large terminal subunit